MVFGTTVATLATEQAFVESTRGFDVTARDQGLSTHGRNLSAGGVQVKARLGIESQCDSAPEAFSKRGSGVAPAVVYNDASGPASLTPPAVGAEPDVLSGSDDGDSDDGDSDEVAELFSDALDVPVSSMPASGSGGM